MEIICILATCFCHAVKATQCASQCSLHADSKLWKDFSGVRMCMKYNRNYTEKKCVSAENNQEVYFKISILNLFCQPVHEINLTLHDSLTEVRTLTRPNNILEP